MIEDKDLKVVREALAMRLDAIADMAGAAAKRARGGGLGRLGLDGAGICADACAIKGMAHGVHELAERLQTKLDAEELADAAALLGEGNVEGAEAMLQVAAARLSATGERPYGLFGP